MERQGAGGVVSVKKSERRERVRMVCAKVAMLEPEGGGRPSLSDSVVGGVREQEW